MVENADAKNAKDFLVLLGNSLLEARDYSGATVVYKYLASLQTDNHLWLIGLCYCLLCSNKLNEAREALHKINQNKDIDSSHKQRLKQRLDYLVAGKVPSVV